MPGLPQQPEVRECERAEEQAERDVMLDAELLQPMRQGELVEARAGKEWN